jgi:16S rRNA U1498 N3-methylase RsmE
MKTLVAVDQDHLALDHERTGSTLYLHEVARRVPLEKPADAAPSEPTKLAIGVEGGFNPEAPQYTVERDFAL